MAEIIDMPERMYCSFCGRDKSMVSWLVRSPYGPCICDECAAQAVEMISDRKLAKSAEVDD